MTRMTERVGLDLKPGPQNLHLPRTAEILAFVIEETFHGPQPYAWFSAQISDRDIVTREVRLVRENEPYDDEFSEVLGGPHTLVSLDGEQAFFLVGKRVEQ